MKAMLLAVLVLSWAAPALAAPAKMQVTAFVKEVEAAVSANLKAIGAGTDATRKHNKLYVNLESKRKMIFVDADACSFAAQSARALWIAMVEYSLGPNDLGYKFLARRQEDYQDNMKACKQSLKALR